MNYSFAALICTAVQRLCQSPGTAAIRVSVFCARLERRTKAQAVLNEPELHRAMFDVLYFPPNTPAKLKTAD